MSDITVGRSNSLLLDVKVTNADGTARNITDGELTFKVFDSPSGVEPVIVGVASVVSGTEGTALAQLDPEDTDIDFSVLYYVINLVEEDGTDTDVQVGKLTVGS